MADLSLESIGVNIRQKYKKSFQSIDLLPALRLDGVLEVNGRSETHWIICFSFFSYSGFFASCLPRDVDLVKRSWRMYIYGGKSV